MARCVGSSAIRRFVHRPNPDCKWLAPLGSTGANHSTSKACALGSIPLGCCALDLNCNGTAFQGSKHRGSHAHCSSADGLGSTCSDYSLLAMSLVGSRRDRPSDSRGLYGRRRTAAHSGSTSNCHFALAPSVLDNGCIPALRNTGHRVR